MGSGELTGGLEVKEMWKRVGVDVTYYASRPYLTLVDHGPSRFSGAAASATDSGQRGATSRIGVMSGIPRTSFCAIMILHSAVSAFEALHSKGESIYGSGVHMLYLAM